MNVSQFKNLRPVPTGLRRKTRLELDLMVLAAAKKIESPDPDTFGPDVSAIRRAMNRRDNTSVVLSIRRLAALNYWPWRVRPMGHNARKESVLESLWKRHPETMALSNHDAVLIIARKLNAANPSRYGPTVALLAKETGWVEKTIRKIIRAHCKAGTWTWERHPNAATDADGNASDGEETAEQARLAIRRIHGFADVEPPDVKPRPVGFHAPETPPADPLATNAAEVAKLVKEWKAIMRRWQPTQSQLETKGDDNGFDRPGFSVDRGAGPIALSAPPPAGRDAVC